jgi:hypothetical protein
MKAIFLSMLALSGLLFAACADDDVVKAKPDSGTTQPTVDSGVLDPDTGKPVGECVNFATENEQLLNAPTDSVPIKKTVVLPQ